MAYCSGDFFVNRCKGLLTSRLTLLYYDNYTSNRHCDVLFFQSANGSWVLVGFIDQDGPVHGIGGFPRCFPL